MKKKDVPQDESSTYAGHKRMLYALGDGDRYEQVESSGWEAEEFITCMAVEELEILTAQARERVEAGESSTLEFHMHNSRLDVLGLAQTSGRFQWQVRRHLKAKHFNKLSDKHLAPYCDAMGLTPEQLKTLPEVSDNV